jgi:hypothetical protein
MRRLALPLTFAAFLALLVAASVRPSAARPQPAEKPRVKLAVLVVFDQMRGDYLDKWKPLFGTDGFARLQDDGAWFRNCYYPYATTATGPGHASMLSGTCPDKHGIINNDWYDRATGETVYCAATPRYKLVPNPPPSPPADKEKKTSAADAKKRLGGTPERMLTETVADTLKRTHPAARVFGLSHKDRSALLPSGKRPDGAYWFVGKFVTSEYYADRVHPWVEAFNTSKAADKWFGKDWTKFRPELDYAKYSGPDDGPGEGKGVGPEGAKTGFQGKTFPHPTTGGKDAVGKTYYEALVNSPYGNDLLLEFAKACVTAERLGTRDVPDLLVVSFSSNDVIGHTWGPDSQEVLDVTLRSDALMADLLGFLDAKVGKGNYVMAVTADHGICPIPEAARAKGLDAKRVDGKALMAAAEKHLQATLGKTDAAAGEAKKTAWVESFQTPWVYLNHRLLKAAGKTPAEAARVLADHLAKQPDVARAFTREELAGEFPAGDVIGRRVKR